jgi:hypothetical protein
MKLAQQIFELEQLVEAGETASYLMPHVLTSLYRLQQIDAPQAARSLYTEAVERYDAWHKHTLGVRMRFSAAQGKAMKAILAYLLQECSNDEQAALNSWQVILDNWPRLNAFLRGQTDLTQINKNLVEIILKIKTAASNDKTGAQRAADLDDLISQGRQ